MDVSLVMVSVLSKFCSVYKLMDTESNSETRGAFEFQQGVVQATFSFKAQAYLSCFACFLKWGKPGILWNWWNAESGASCLTFYFILPFWNILIRQVPISSYSLFCLISVSLALKWYTMVFVWFTFLSGQTSTSTVSFNICTVLSWLGCCFFFNVCFGAVQIYLVSVTMVH